MKAVVVKKHGDVSVLEMTERPDPAPGKGEILISVKAAGVNFADVLARLGIYKAAPKPPFVPGIEVAGTVEALGDGVEGFAAGDRVMAFCTFGGYAEKVAVPTAYAFKVPDGMTFPEAAAFPGAVPHGLPRALPTRPRPTGRRRADPRGGWRRGHRLPPAPEEPRGRRLRDGGQRLQGRGREGGVSRGAAHSLPGEGLCKGSSWKKPAAAAWTW